MTQSSREPLSGVNFLIISENTGNFRDFGCSRSRFAAEKPSSSESRLEGRRR
jgi:hypothetical protein